MNVNLYKNLFLLLMIIGSFLNKANAQMMRYVKGESLEILKNLSGKYIYSTTNLNYLKLKTNKVNFLSLLTQYYLDSAEKKFNNLGGPPKTYDEISTYHGDGLDYRDLLFKANNLHLDSVEKILDFISSDIALKYFNNYRIDTTVEVTVKVIKERNNEELDGYNVFASPSLSVDPSDIIPFNPTKNAIKKIRPGRKRFWIEKNGFTREIPNWGVSVDDVNTHLIIFRVR